MTLFKYVVYTGLGAVVWQFKKPILQSIGMTSTEEGGCPFGFGKGDGKAPHPTGDQPQHKSDKVDRVKLFDIPPAERLERGLVPQLRVFQPAELKKFDGSEEGQPLYLCVLGEVYDVTSGAKMYAKGNGYEVFLGQDSSRAFHDGNFDRSLEDVLDLDVMQLQDVTGWRRFYRIHESYTFIGVRVGLYYDSNGAPTESLAKVEELHKKGSDILALEAQRTAMFPSCHFYWMQNPENGQMATRKRCTHLTEEDGVVRYIRAINYRHAGTGNAVNRCVCVTQEAIENKPDWVDSFAQFQLCGDWDTVCWQ